MPWTPTRFKRFESRVASSMGVCRVVTDAGKAHIKCLGNKTGPHGLAADWIGTSLASLMGLPTFEFSILEILDEDLPFDENGREEPGPAFATKTESGITWDGENHSLESLANRNDLAKLVILDTWLANWDRCSPSGDRINRDNVFLSLERNKGVPTLIAMDFSHCIGKYGELTNSVNTVTRIRDTGVYSSFDGFVALIDDESVRGALNSLADIAKNDIKDILRQIPSEWEVSTAILESVYGFLMDRKSYVYENFRENARCQIGPQLKFTTE